MSLEKARKPGREGHALARAAYNQGITEPGQTPTALLHAWSRGEPGAPTAITLAKADKSLVKPDRTIHLSTTVAISRNQATREDGRVRIACSIPIEFILYDADDTVLGSVTIDGENFGSGWLVHYLYFEEGEIELIAGETYRLVCKPTETHTTWTEGWDFNSATDRQTVTYPESERWYKTERTDGGAWTDTNTSIVQMGLIVSQISTGTSGSGAGPGATNYYGFIG